MKDLWGAQLFTVAADAVNLGTITVPAPADSFSGRITGLPAWASCDIAAVKPSGASYTDAYLSSEGYFTLVDKRLRGNKVFLVTAQCRVSKKSGAQWVDLRPEYLTGSGWTTTRTKAKKFMMRSAESLTVGTYRWKSLAKPSHHGTIRIKGQVKSGKRVTVSTSRNIGWSHVAGTRTGIHFELCNLKEKCTVLKSDNLSVTFPPSVVIPQGSKGKTLKVVETYCDIGGGLFVEVVASLGGAVPVIASYSKSVTVS